MTARLDDLAQPGVEALNGIGRVDHPTDRRREGEEGNDPSIFLYLIVVSIILRRH
jgi:hypothetical protein